MPEISTPARSNIPPLAPKSFCISMTSTAARDASIAIDPGLAGMVIARSATAFGEWFVRVGLFIATAGVTTEAATAPANPITCLRATASGCDDEIGLPCFKPSPPREQCLPDRHKHGSAAEAIVFLP